MQLPVQNQIPCAGSFGCQRIHVALNKHDDKLDRLEEICFMEKLITRKEAAEILGISIATLDAARNNGLISYVQYVQNGCVYFTSAGLQEYIAKCTHRAKPAEKNATYRFYDRLAQNKDTQNTYFMFCLFVYGFLAVITLITIIHTVNSISMSVSARTNQYGAMRAVGMDSLQIKKMILMETATYTTLGLLAGCGLGLPLHHFLYSQMITNYWGTAWQIPLTSIGEILVLLVFTSLLAPFAPEKRICNMPITATINEL